MSKYKLYLNLTKIDIVVFISYFNNFNQDKGFYINTPIVYNIENYTCLKLSLCTSVQHSLHFLHNFYT